MTPERWRRMEDVFHEARACAPELRDAYLAEACEGDSALRRDVEALLAQPDGSIVDGGAAGILTALTEASRESLEGRMLGPYQIGALLGSGGMGDVYRARDTKLGRDVAVKILPVLTAGPADPSSRQARFAREARILAQLSHPHIATIHGFEEAEGIRALILELVEGLSLKERLAAGALPLEEAIAIARQVIDALDAAHQKGIIHRDLKPANIQITPQGDVKVLDFGLARMEDAGDGGPGAGAVLETRDGMLLGTVAYMSPEQARGIAVDRRTDIWAFGCVLFQMLTGTRPFDGETVADVIAEVTRSEPDWSRLPAATPVGVRRLLRRCLVKDRDRRLRDIADARLDLDETAEGAGLGDLSTTTPADRCLAGRRRAPGRRVARPRPRVVGRGLPGRTAARLRGRVGRARPAVRAVTLRFRKRAHQGHRRCPEPVLLAGRSMAGILVGQRTEEDAGRWWSRLHDHGLGLFRRGLGTG